MPPTKGIIGGVSSAFIKFQPSLAQNPVELAKEQEYSSEIISNKTLSEFYTHQVKKLFSTGKAAGKAHLTKAAENFINSTLTNDLKFSLLLKLQQSLNIDGGSITRTSKANTRIFAPIAKYK